MFKQVIFPVILFYSLFLSVNLPAQNMRIEAPPGYNIIFDENNLPKNIEGSPYLDDWQLSDIILKNGEVISGIMVCYNVFANQMLFQSNNTYILGVPDSISEIKLPNRIFVYKNYRKANKIEKGYFEILLSGKVGLLAKYETKIIPSNYNVALGVGNKNDRLVIKEQLYLQKEEQIILLNKESILYETLNEKYREVSDYMNKKRLSYKKKQDMIQLLSFYNQLN